MLKGFILTEEQIRRFIWQKQNLLSESYTTEYEDNNGILTWFHNGISTLVLMGFCKHTKTHFRPKKSEIMEGESDFSSNRQVFRALYKQH